MRLMLSNAVAGNLERRMSPARCGRLTGEPQVAFLGATDPTADRQTGDHPDQVSTYQTNAMGRSQVLTAGAQEFLHPASLRTDFGANPPRRAVPLKRLLTDRTRERVQRGLGRRERTRLRAF